MEAVPAPEIPFRDVSVTAQTSQKAVERACPICGIQPESRRATYCSHRCQMIAFRRRHGHQQLARELSPASLSKPSPEHVVYECPACETRFLGEQRCELFRHRNKSHYADLVLMPRWRPKRGRYHPPTRHNQGPAKKAMRASDGR